jgi:hypothetical protein
MKMWARRIALCGLVALAVGVMCRDPTQSLAETTVAGSATPPASQPQGDQAKAELKTEQAKGEAPKSDSAKTEVKKDSAAFAWDSNVWAPLVRLAGIVAIFGVLLWFLDLPSVLRSESWSERTILALAIIFTYCAAMLMGASEVVSPLKDDVLVVIGFYFGASKGSREEQPPARKEPPAAQGAAKPADQGGQAEPAAEATKPALSA